MVLVTQDDRMLSIMMCTSCGIFMKVHVFIINGLIMLLVEGSASECFTAKKYYHCTITYEGMVFRK